MTDLLISINRVVFGILKFFSDVLENFVGPAWALCIISAVIGVILTFFYGKLVNEKTVKNIKRQVSAKIYEAILFRNDAFVTLKAQLGLLGSAARYLGSTIIPISILFIPSIIILSSLNTLFGISSLDESGKGVLKIYTDKQINVLDVKTFTTNGSSLFRSQEEHLIMQNIDYPKQQTTDKTLQVQTSDTSSPADITDITLNHHPKIQSNDPLSVFLWGAQKRPPSGFNEIRLENAIKLYDIFGIQMEWIIWSIIFILLGGIAAIKIFSVPI